MSVVASFAASWLASSPRRQDDSPVKIGRREPVSVDGERNAPDRFGVVHSIAALRRKRCEEFSAIRLEPNNVADPAPRTIAAHGDVILFRADRQPENQNRLLPARLPRRSVRSNCHDSFCCQT